MKDLMTNSRLRVYRECARKERLMFVDLWRPVREDDNLAFGSLGHLGLEAWWNAVPAGQDPLTAALAVVAGRARDPYQQASVEELLKGYDARWLPEADKYDVLHVEAQFVAPLLNPETWAASRTWDLGGKVDVIVRERDSGRVLVVEHKFTGESVSDPTAPYWAKLTMDGQVSHYFIGAESLGEKVEGCIYDVIAKPGQRPLKATPVESRKYTKDGKLYAAQRENDETPEQYRARVAEAIAADPLGFFQRRSVPRLESDLRDYLFDVWQYGQQIREAHNGGRAPRNPDACHRFGTCAFWDVCANGLKPEDHPDLYQRGESAHPELVLNESSAQGPKA